MEEKIRTVNFKDAICDQQCAIVIKPFEAVTHAQKYAASGLVSVWRSDSEARHEARAL